MKEMNRPTIRSSTARKTASAFAVIFLVLILLISLLPQILGYKVYYVSTGSMEKTIMRGSMVILEEVSFEDISVGDIITFEDAQKGSTFTHRVVEINSEFRFFITRGDAGTANDPKPTGYEYVEGRVKYTIPFLGYLSMLIDSAAGKVMIAAGYIIWIAIEIELFRTKRGKAGVS